MQKSWTDLASDGLTRAKNAAAIRQKIVDWVDANGPAWGINTSRSKSFPDGAAHVLVTVTKTAATKVSIDRVETGF
jgi:hypothetical protein